MELGSKVTALEEEVSVLKGEIKMILQEVRTAVLARENPFAVDHETLHIPTSTPEPAPEIQAPEAEAPPKVVQLQSSTELAQHTAQETPAIPFPGRDETDAARPAAQFPAKRRWSAGSLATLIAWTQETATRMDASDLDIVLSLARYGGLIDEELEATLLKLAAPLFVLEEDAAPRQKGVTDYLLALRELAALIEEAESSYLGAGPLRRAS